MLWACQGGRLREIVVHFVGLMQLASIAGKILPPMPLSLPLFGAQLIGVHPPQAHQNYSKDYLDQVHLFAALILCTTSI